MHACTWPLFFTLRPAEVQAILSFKSQTNLHRRQPRRVSFSREELRQLLDMYSRRVAAGEWRDYAIDHGPDRAIFSVFRHTADIPLFKITKTVQRGAGPHYRFTLLRGGEKLRQDPTIAAVVAEVNRRPRLISIR